MYTFQMCRLAASFVRNQETKCLTQLRQLINICLAVFENRNFAGNVSLLLLIGMYLLSAEMGVSFHNNVASTFPCTD